MAQEKYKSGKICLLNEREQISEIIKAKKTIGKIRVRRPKKMVRLSTFEKPNSIHTKQEERRRVSDRCKNFRIICFVLCIVEEKLY